MAGVNRFIQNTYRAAIRTRKVLKNTNDMMLDATDPSAKIGLGKRIAGASLNTLLDQTIGQTGIAGSLLGTAFRQATGDKDANVFRDAAQFALRSVTSQLGMLGSVIDAATTTIPKIPDRKIKETSHIVGADVLRTVQEIDKKLVRESNLLRDESRKMQAGISKQFSVVTDQYQKLNNRYDALQLSQRRTEQLVQKLQFGAGIAPKASNLNTPIGGNDNPPPGSKGGVQGDGLLSDLASMIGPKGLAVLGGSAALLSKRFRGLLGSGLKQLPKIARFGKFALPISGPIGLGIGAAGLAYEGYKYYQDQQKDTVGGGLFGFNGVPGSASRIPMLKPQQPQSDYANNVPNKKNVVSDLSGNSIKRISTNDIKTIPEINVIDFILNAKKDITFTAQQNFRIKGDKIYIEARKVIFDCGSIENLRSGNRMPSPDTEGKAIPASYSPGDNLNAIDPNRDKAGEMFSGPSSSFSDKNFNPDSSSSSYSGDSSSSSSGIPRPTTGYTPGSIPGTVIPDVSRGEIPEIQKYLSPGSVSSNSNNSFPSTGSIGQSGSISTKAPSNANTVLDQTMNRKSSGDKIGLTADKKGNVTRPDLFNFLKQEISNSKLNGMIPADGKKYGIDGTPESWAHYMTRLSHDYESSGNIYTQGDKGRFGTGSNSLFQISEADALTYGIQKNKFTMEQMRNPEINARTAIKIHESLIGKTNSIRKGAGQYWSPLKGKYKATPYTKGMYGEEQLSKNKYVLPGMQRVAENTRNNADLLSRYKGDMRNDFSIDADFLSRDKGEIDDFSIDDATDKNNLNFGKFKDSPKGMIIHHTSGRGKVSGVMSTFKDRGLATQFIIDRDGKITRVLAEGQRGAHMKPGQGVGDGLGNQNMEGVEIIAKNDADVTDAQKAAAKRLVAMRSDKFGYDPKTSVYGHGEVNQHKESNEGMSTVSDIRANGLDREIEQYNRYKSGNYISIKPSGSFADSDVPMENRGITNGMQRVAENTRNNADLLSRYKGDMRNDFSVAMGVNPDQQILPGSMVTGANKEVGDYRNVPRMDYRRKGLPGEFNYATSQAGQKQFGAFLSKGFSKNMVGLETQNGKKYNVHKDVADRIQAFVSNLEKGGYKIKDIGGYNTRLKRGSSTSWSSHSSGTTIDINQNENNFRPDLKHAITDFPKDIEDLAAKYGLSWGGRFGDSMHFEVMSPELQEQKAKQLLAKGSITEQEYTAIKDKSYYNKDYQKSFADFSGPKNVPMENRGITNGMQRGTSKDSASMFDNFFGQQKQAFAADTVSPQGFGAEQLAAIQANAIRSSQILAQSSGLAGTTLSADAISPVAGASEGAGDVVKSASSDSGMSAKDSASQNGDDSQKINPPVHDPEAEAAKPGSDGYGRGDGRPQASGGLPNEG